MNQYNAASRRHIREAEKEVKASEEERKIVVHSIMEHRGGRAWMYSVLQDCHVYASSFTNNALSTAFREGERNVGLKLLAQIMEASPNNYVLMTREADDRSRAAEQRRSPNGNGRTQAEPELSTDDDSDDPTDTPDASSNGVERGPNEVDYGVKAG